MSRKNHILPFFILWLATVLPAQQYVTAGLGFSGVSVLSDDLDDFKNSYNRRNAFVLTKQLQGFSLGVGLRAEFGYRYLAERSMAVAVGYQQTETHDVANFSNNDSRKLTLQISSLYVDYEYGHNWGSFFTNGLLSLHLNRDVRIRSTYKSDNADTPRSLTGVYENGNSFSADLGASVGIYRSVFFAVFKISYPLYTVGTDEKLSNDARPPDISAFPAEYEKYVRRQTYKSVTSDVDGLKLSVSISYAFEIGK